MSKKGYVFSVCQSPDDPYIPDALHVERDDDCVPWRYETDEEAARAAEQDGVKLLYGIPHVEDGIYLDTSENRQILNDYSANIQRASLLTVASEKPPQQAVSKKPPRRYKNAQER